LIGGKWTTFRAFGEQVADQILPHLERPRLVSSADLPIGGGRVYPRTASEKQLWLATIGEGSHLPVARLEELLDRYGTRAAGVVEFLGAASDRPLRWLPEYSEREIQFVAAQERVAHLEDLVLRRTLIGVLGQLTLNLLNELASVVAPVLGWADDRARQEIDRTIETLRRVHGVQLPERSGTP
jgi:glycerol-3-phosphate dehydrogenase